MYQRGYYTEVKKKTILDIEMITILNMILCSGRYVNSKSKKINISK